MGGSAASRPIIDYEVARRRLGYAEVSKIEEGFERLAVGGQLQRSEFRTGFLNSIAGAPVPEAFASALFNGFDTTAAGHISVKQFICALAILRYGTPEERLRLLFAVYDADRDHRLSDRDLARFAHALEDGRHGTRQKAIDDALQALAAAGPSLSFDRFEKWASQHMTSPLIDWVFQGPLTGPLEEGPSPVAAVTRMVPLERSLSMDNREERKELESLSNMLGLEFEFAKELRTVWVVARDQSQFGVVDTEAFLRALRSAPRPLGERLFRALDVTRSATVSLHEWMRGLGICIVGPPELRRELCFELFASSVGDASGEAEGSRMIVPASVELLRRFADSSVTVFTEISQSRRPSKRPPESAADEAPSEEVDASGDTAISRLTLAELSTEPWASRAEALVRGIGQLARVDLGMQPRDPHEEREIVDRLNAKFHPERPGSIGDTWYLISARWWEQWCQSTGAEEATFAYRRRGELSIDNCALMEHRSLRIGLSHRVDYEVITEGAWRALNAWYGGPGPELPRQVIELEGRCELEMYPLHVHVNRSDPAGEVLLHEESIEISRAARLEEVRRLACALFHISQPVSLWHRRDANLEWAEVGDETQTLHAAGFINRHRVLLQVQGRVPPSPAESTSPGGREKVGAVGLQNLGNTCYMNASLQCLVHTPLLPSYFLVEYQFDLNTVSSWGMAGKLAVSFAELLEEIDRARRNGEKFIAPSAFRRTIGNYQPQFGGWKQQDTQEFLSIFLAGLSEDVNRTRDKPYVELKDSEGRPDAEVASEFWTAHCRREHSVIAALFSSQFKSVLRCTVCGHENAAFDPFSFLPIPLPEHDFRWITSNVVSAPQNGPADQHTVQVCTRVPKRGHMADLLQAVAGLTGLAASELVAAEVAEGYIFRLWEQGLPLSSLSDDARPVVFHAPPPDRWGSPANASSIAGAAEAVAETGAQHASVVAAGVAEASIKTVAGGEWPASARSGSDFAPSPRPQLQAASKQKGGLLSPAGSASSPTQATLPPTIDLISRIVTIYIVHRRLRKVERYFLNPYKSELFGMPALLRLPEQCPAAELYLAVFRQVRHLIPDYTLIKGQWPFALSTVKRDGSACTDCTWREGCLGCQVFVGPSAPPLELTPEMTLGIDWDAGVLEKQYKEKIAGHVHVHESVELARIERNAPENVVQCVETLTKPEEITAYCRDCTKKAGEFTETPHTKVLRIWACGPLLVLQLKRFHSNQGSSYKLHNLVTFPLRFDLQDFLAQSPPFSSEVHREEGHHPDGPMAGPERQEESSESEPAAKSVRRAAGSTAKCAKTSQVAFKTLSRDRTSYDLYGVVNHIGGMGSGHYTAFVRRGRPSGQARWFCCNDSGVYSISEEDLITPNAYLLFYARTDLMDGEVDLHHVFPVATGQGPAIDPQDVKRATWASRQSGAQDKERSSTAGNFCGVM